MFVSELEKAIGLDHRSEFWSLLRNTAVGVAGTLTVYLVSVLQWDRADISKINESIILENLGNQEWGELVALYVLTRLVAIGLPVAIYGVMACEGLIIPIKGTQDLRDKAGIRAMIAVVASGIIVVPATWAVIYLVSPSSSWLFLIVICAFAAIIVWSFCRTIYKAMKM